MAAVLRATATWDANDDDDDDDDDGDNVYDDTATNETTTKTMPERHTTAPLGLERSPLDKPLAF